MSDLVTSFEEELATHGTLIYRNRGVSMMPMLRQDRDLMVIEQRPEGRCRKYDVVLYKRNNQYILHRILKVLPDGYVICGDHNWKKDPIVREEQILGRLVSFVRDGREISAENPLYQCYVHLWCDLFPARALLLRTRAKMGKNRRRMTG